MRPDRFGQSRNREFSESPGRERDHPFEGGNTGYTGIRVIMLMEAFSVGSQDFPGPAPTSTFSSWKMYRSCSMGDNVRFNNRFYDRDVGMTYSGFINNGLIGPYPVPDSRIDFQKNKWSETIGPGGLSGLGNVIRTQTTQSLVVADGIACNRQLSNEIDLGAWIRFAKKFLDQVNEFPSVNGRVTDWVLMPRYGFNPPIDPPDGEVSLTPGTVAIPQTGQSVATLEWGDYMLVTPFTSTASTTGYSLFTVDPSHGGNNQGSWPFTAPDYSGQVFLNIPIASFRIEMIKVLMHLEDMPATVARRTIERANTSFEIIESISSVPTEVLDSPVEPLSRLDDRWPKESENLVERRMYQLPGSPNPPAA